MKKLLSIQLWSKANPEIIIEWGLNGAKPDSSQPYWSISIDTPKYGYYSKYMELTRGAEKFTKHELEDFITKNLLPPQT